MTSKKDTRERLIVAMSQALQRRGMNGIGLTEILVAAQAPKGVLYHHFPGGKAQLTVEAIGYTVQRTLTQLDKLFGGNPRPLDGLIKWFRVAEELLAETAFERGCPLATVALESTANDTSIREALAAGFESIRAGLSRGLQAAGYTARRADGLAALIVAAYEGGLLQARVQCSARPMRQVTETLVTLLEAAGLPEHA
jgi:TetR/AcrR family transcriptional repressor of lmrAB and yxaGH operons